MGNLYVSEQGARLEREYDRILVAKDNSILLEAPIIKISGIVLVGRIGITTPALHLLLEKGIPLVFLNRHGEFLGRLSGDSSSNTNLKRAQYRRDGQRKFCLQVACAMASGKIWNCRVRCLRIAAATDNPVAEKAAKRLKDILDELPGKASLASVRAQEAQASRVYFGVIRTHLNQAWKFPSRKRRPPPDPVNVLLSATYTLLTEAVYSAITVVGLDPYCGFYHTERPGRPALVLDLMEEFRPLIADSVVLTLINKRILTPQDFHPGNTDRPVILSPDGYKKVLQEFGDRLRETVTVPRLNHRTNYHRLLEIQARELAHTIQGQNDGYEPFRSR